MMVTFAVWLVVFGAAAGYGRLLAPATRNDDGASGAVQVYAGLLLLSTMLLAAALVTDLSPWIGAGVALPGVALFWRSQLSFRELRYPLAGLMVLALFISVREINFYDTGLYHQQAVKWLAQTRHCTRSRARGLSSRLCLFVVRVRRSFGSTA